MAGSSIDSPQSFTPLHHSQTAALQLSALPPTAHKAQPPSQSEQVLQAVDQALQNTQRLRPSAAATQLFQALHTLPEAIADPATVVEIFSRLQSNAFGQSMLRQPQADLSGFDLHQLRRDQLTNIYLIGANLQDANLQGVDLSGTASGVQPALPNIDLSYADLRGANLQGADLSHANLIDTDLSGADLRGANLQSAQLNSGRLVETDLTGAQLQGAFLSSANLSGAQLAGANLAGAQLPLANLYSAHLAGAQLNGAHLHARNLVSANCSGANLQNANLSHAKLIGTNLSGADLTGANMSSALLQRTHLTNAIFRGSINWTRAFFDQVIINKPLDLAGQLIQLRYQQTSLPAVDPWIAAIFERAATLDFPGFDQAVADIVHASAARPLTWLDVLMSFQATPILDTYLSSLLLRPDEVISYS